MTRSEARALQHNAHVDAFWNHIMDEILAVLGPVGAPDGWADWSRYASQGEW
jgi:hypothetical protein